LNSLQFIVIAANKIIFLTASTIIFYILAAIVLGGGLLAVTSRKIFRSAIYLLFSLIGIAGLYFYMNYEFIAAVQIVVYVGGIVVLIIFSIFLTHEAGADMKRPAWTRIIFAALAALFGFALVMMLVRDNEFYPSGAPAVDAGAGSIGSQMLSTTEHGYILPFEVVSMLLLAAMIGCIVIAIKSRTPGTETADNQSRRDAFGTTDNL
jgi:NADH-quinone oxidoreductase subunit J